MINFEHYEVWIILMREMTALVNYSICDKFRKCLSKDYVCVFHLLLRYTFIEYFL